MLMLIVTWTHPSISNLQISCCLGHAVTVSVCFSPRYLCSLHEELSGSSPVSPVIEDMLLRNWIPWVFRIGCRDQQTLWGLSAASVLTVKTRAIRIDWLGLDHYIMYLTVAAWAAHALQVSSSDLGSCPLNTKKKVKYIQIYWKGSHYNTEPRPLPLRTCGPQCPQSKRPTKVYQGSDAFKEPTIASLAAFPVGTWTHLYSTVGLCWVGLDRSYTFFFSLDRCYHNRSVRGNWMRIYKDPAEMPVESTMWMLRKDWHKRTKTQQQAHQVAYIGQPTKQQHRKSVGVRQPVCKVVVVLWCCMLLYSECKPIQFNEHPFQRFRCLSEAAPSYKLTESIYQSINQKCIGQSILTKQQAGFRALGQRCTAYSLQPGMQTTSGPECPHSHLWWVASWTFNKHQQKLTNIKINVM